MHATKWIPMRFSTCPDLNILDKGAFVPWGTGMCSLQSLTLPLFHFLKSLPGRYSCPGKQMSLMELRVATAVVCLLRVKTDDDCSLRQLTISLLQWGPMQLVMQDRSQLRESGLKS